MFNQRLNEFNGLRMSRESRTDGDCRACLDEGQDAIES